MGAGMPQDRADKQLDDFFAQVTNIKVGSGRRPRCRLDAAFLLSLSSVRGVKPRDITDFA